MEEQKKLSIILEAVFLLITAVVIVGFLRPIVANYTNFPFLWRNVLAIIVFITYTRYLFLWKHTLFAKSNVVRGLIMVTSIPLVFFLVQNLNLFQSYLDDFGYDTFMELLKEPLSDERRFSLLKYIRSQYVFFSIGAIIASVVLPIRMIISFYRTKNDKGV